MGFGQFISDYCRLTWRFKHDSEARIIARQSREVMALIAFARQSSSFYRDLYAGYDVHDLGDFARLPTIDKKIMMTGFDRLNTAGLRLEEVMHYALEKELHKDYLGYYQDNKATGDGKAASGRYVVGLSSGTSGNKGIYVTDSAMTRRLPGVFLARGGVRLSDLPMRILFILRVFSQGFADIRAPLLSLEYLSSMTPPENIIEKLNQQRINILMAPPSLLRQLLPLADQIRTPPRRVITYAEVLEPESKARLSDAFRAPVAEIYQASEGQIASPCRLGNLHINEDLVYVELLDSQGKPVRGPEDGRATRMLVTNLVNRVQPLIRYEMNDIIELGSPCACGSKFRVISRVIGRNDDVLELPVDDGTPKALYPDLVSRWIITTDDRIREFIVEQDAADHLLITLDIPDADSRPEIESSIKSRFAAELDEYGFVCRLDIVHRPIKLPADNRKLKRFFRHGDR